MTPIQKRALEYVKNTGGTATIENFVEDHAPVGEQLWEQLDFADLVCCPNNDKIALTKKGQDFLENI